MAHPAKPVFQDKEATAARYGADGTPKGSLVDGSDQDAKIETVESYYTLPFWTRMGCTPESFKRRTLADKNNQLNQTLRTRHMHMIAIGEYTLHRQHILVLTWR